MSSHGAKEENKDLCPLTQFSSRYNIIYIKELSLPANSTILSFISTELEARLNNLL